MPFPAGPYTNGQTWTEAGTTYTYNSTIGGWLKPTGGGVIPSTRSVTGTLSLTGGGTLAANRTIQLVNDAASPGANKVYGTIDTNNVKGWQAGANPIAYMSGNISGTANYATNAYFTCNNIVDGGITTTAASGTSINLLSGWQYVIDAYVIGASVGPPLMSLYNRTTNTLLVQFSGSISFTWHTNANVAIGLRYDGATTLVNPSGGIRVYSI